MRIAALALLVCPAGLLGQASPPAHTSASPDFAGVWRRSRRAPDNKRQYTVAELVQPLGDPPPMTAWGQARFNAAKPNIGPRSVPFAESNDPTTQCLPPGIPRLYTVMLGAPFELLQVPGRIIMFFENNHYVRQIFIDGRPHSDDTGPTYLGDAIGKWEGTTLVVDTVGFNDKTWLDTFGHPHSDALHLVERFQRPKSDVLTDDISINDPKAYTKPWLSHMIFDHEPGWNIQELVCEDNLNFKDLQKLSESHK